MSAAFDVLFALFVLSMAVIAVIAVRWGRQRDRIARARSGPSRTRPEGSGRRDGATP